MKFLPITYFVGMLFSHGCNPAEQSTVTCYDAIDWIFHTTTIMYCDLKYWIWCFYLWERIAHSI